MCKDYETESVYSRAIRAVKLFLTMALSSVQTAEILNFSQSTDAVAPGGNITFICEVIGRSAEWKINDTFRYQSDPTRGFFINVPIRNDTISDYLLLRLTITAYEYNNSSKISCFGFDQDTQQDKLFIIAGPPSEPQPRFSYTDNGLSLTITWNKPFTHTGFNITAYSLLIYNTSDSTMRNVTLGQQRMYYVDVIDTAPTNCHELQYIVTAYNSLGSNAASVIAGYPISLDPVEIQWRVLYNRDSAPHLEIWFKPAYVCSFQDVEYTVYLENVSGNSTLQTYGDVLYSVHSGLSVGANYTVIIEERSTVGLTVSRQDIVIEVLHSQIQSTVEALPSQSHQQVQIHNTAIGGLAVCLVVSLVLFFIFLALYCKQRKKAKYLRKISVDTANNGRPSTLRTRSSATKLNPIYEGGGPVYESPGGEPLRALLSTSTPSTPNTPLDNNNPRYVFDMPPPDLPPPRKLQFVLPNAPSCNGGNLEEDQEKADLKVALEEPEYTMMRPIRAVKPSPLILST
ncbi:uncharacterized protein LOC135345371 isoform X2 [Halichondria panicea]|uniref:uncharacterized protein LOC135345371 isoform X2 n=1 Tax=Halichondria panicea TaxID=6063 RepID=UPI00312B3A47